MNGDRELAGYYLSRLAWKRAAGQERLSREYAIARFCDQLY